MPLFYKRPASHACVEGCFYFNYLYCMPENHSRIVMLLKKQVDQTELSQEEQVELDQWISHNDTNRQLYNMISDEARLAADFTDYYKFVAALQPEPLHFIKQDDVSIEDAGFTGNEDLSTQEFVRNLPRRNMMKRMAVAATILILLTAATIIYFSADKKQPPSSPNASITTSPEAAPASQRATLTLSDNRVIDLTQSPDGDIAKEGIATVRKSADGKIEYDKSGNTDITVMHTLKTPRGGYYQIRLSDGTRVWLNAASQLQFPAAFSGVKRTVNLKGEAYFEVAENKNAPFEVITSSGNVTVLGTRFNIRNYEQEPMASTLLQGAVQVKASNAAAAIILSPDQQAVIDGPGKNIIVHHVVGTDFIAWQQGVFTFHNASLQQVMNELGRWYDIQVVYKPDIDISVIYQGEFDRNSKLSWILKQLSQMSGYHFELKDKTVTISK